MMPLQPHLDKARRWCALQERSALQVLTRLQGEGLAPPQALEVLQILQQEGFQDDARLAMVYARSKAVHAAWGPAKIRAALRRIGIDNPHIQAALDALDTEAADARLDKTLAHKWQTLQKETDPRQRKAKLLRYLLQKGFAYAQIQAALVRLDIR